MSKLTPTQIETIVELNVAPAFRHFAETYRINERTGKPEPDPTKPPHVDCDIYDKTTGALFVTGTGQNESDALDNALAKARTTPAPLTPAQKAQAEKLAATLTVKDTRIAELEAELAAAKGEGAAPGRRSKAG